MGQKERVDYHRDNQCVKRRGQCTIDVSSWPVEEDRVTYGISSGSVEDGSVP